jgi:putative glutamine amidotransferase
MRYGATDGERNTGVDPARDEVEIALTRRCLELGRPILGICRGTQVLNVAAGGTLIQDIAATPGGWLDHPRPPAVKPSALRHSVSVTPGSLAAISLGFEPSGDDRPTIRVNSSHHQAVGDLAPGFVASAWAEDGIIEAIEARAMPGFALGVQWHPEHLLYIEAMAGLFVAFVNAARDRAQEA